MLSRFFAALAACCLLAQLAPAPHAHALSIPVDMTLTRKEGETNAALAGRARQALFAQAVVLAAPTLLPGTLSTVRRELLAQYLRPRANRYVQGYAEGGQAVIGDEMVVTATVEVDEAALESLLTSLGVACTLDTPQPYGLRTGAGVSGAGQDVTRLQLLSGLVRSRVEDPALRLDFDGKVWSGELDSRGRTRMASGGNLDDVWLSLWSGFFADCGSQAAGGGHVEVVVAGFSIPDQPLALHGRISKLLPRYHDAELVQISVTGGELTATWTVNADSATRVREDWDLALGAKGLRVVSALPQGVSQTEPQAAGAEMAAPGQPEGETPAQ